jgi:hypothetical protein
MKPVAPRTKSVLSILTPLIRSYVTVTTAEETAARRRPSLLYPPAVLLHGCSGDDSSVVPERRGHISRTGDVRGDEGLLD